MSSVAVADRVDVSVKARRVWVVVLLSIVTFGVYNLYWYYTINRELRDFGAARSDHRLGSTRPWLSVLAAGCGVTMTAVQGSAPRVAAIGGALFIATGIIKLVSLIATTRRVQAAERLAVGWHKPATTEVTLFVGSMVAPFGAALNGLPAVAILVAIACLLTAVGMIQTRLNAIWATAVKRTEISPEGRLVTVR